MKQTTPQTVIDAWRPHREERRPSECDHREGCWVVNPFGTVSRVQGTPRCLACGGRIDGYADTGAAHLANKRGRWQRRVGAVTNNPPAPQSS